MMTPIHRNPLHSTFPFVELKEDQRFDYLSPPHQASSSHCSSSFFNLAQDHREYHLGHNQQKVDGYALHGESNHQIVIQRVANDSTGGHIHMACEREDDHVGKSDNTSTRLTQEMNPDCSGSFKPSRYHNNEKKSAYHSNETVRVCSDCNTTKTPLWRSGPRGPKSLCNACGIRQRKARRAMAAAANGTEVATDASSSNSKVHKGKEKQPRTSHAKQHRINNCKLLGSSKKLSFEDFALSLSRSSSALRRVFPQDEKEAAILLMAISCGLVCS